MTVTMALQELEIAIGKAISLLREGKVIQAYDTLKASYSFLDALRKESMK